MTHPRYPVGGPVASSHRLRSLCTKAVFGAIRRPTPPRPSASLSGVGDSQ